MMSRDYEFMSEFMEWFNNSSHGRRYGKFSWIYSVSVEASGCDEGTCQWEDIVITGDGEDDAQKTVRLVAADVQKFFRDIGST